MWVCVICILYKCAAFNFSTTQSFHLLKQRLYNFSARLSVLVAHIIALSSHHCAPSWAMELLHFPESLAARASYKGWKEKISSPGWMNPKWPWECFVFSISHWLFWLFPLDKQIFLWHFWKPLQSMRLISSWIQQIFIEHLPCLRVAVTWRKC